MKIVEESLMVSYKIRTTFVKNGELTDLVNLIDRLTAALTIAEETINYMCDELDIKPDVKMALIENINTSDLKLKNLHEKMKLGESR